LPLETLISQTQKNHYEALSISDKAGKSTAFIEYMLQIIDQAPSNLLNINGKTISVENRIAYFISLGKTDFARKEYMDVFKTISTATASRDLKKAMEQKLLTSEGSGNQMRYYVI